MLTVSVQMLESASLGARPNAKKVILIITDGQVSAQFVPNYQPAISRLTTDILRMGDIYIFIHHNTITIVIFLLTLLSNKTNYTVFQKKVHPSAFRNN